MIHTLYTRLLLLAQMGCYMRICIYIYVIMHSCALHCIHNDLSRAQTGGSAVYPSLYSCFIYLQFKALLYCFKNCMHVFGETLRARSPHSAWVVHPSIHPCPVLCFPVYHQHPQWRVVVLASSLFSAHMQQRASSLSQLWCQKQNMPGSFHPAKRERVRNERKHKRLGVTPMHAAALLKNVVELSALLPLLSAQTAVKPMTYFTSATICAFSSA